jgi:hypothetical protein
VYNNILPQDQAGFKTNKLSTTTTFMMLKIKITGIMKGKMYNTIVGLNTRRNAS